ncbi:ATP-binding cassette domain-containing protein [Nonomuraea sp. KC401]|uniref:ATP-binding cassette domain-containing protein n=1 Tax=unclassified Nonomuraea TaxID=2593643 RepID=UPI0010FD9BDB|nr:ATP-binding cassette domain-containing protein [Nonomuraea sp. KC401]NBE93979.1 ATP-binding cassette domain-containing protein [Nonomuraea sp. K271]TLF80228.1 ATP-binding cassette domain-containing protein [Nonomuraea sp. KC401]
MIEVRRLTKVYGAGRAVDRLTFTVKPGVVTGFLGPNGAGKTTTLRMVMGLDRPTEGTATVAGRRYADLADPLRTVGALLDARAVHPRRTARDHLRCLAASGGIADHRVDDVLGLVGLDQAARRRAGEFSLGMSQRLGIAAALLGDPEVLVLDEPVNGLDPEGIRWIRGFMRSLAAEGRTVLVSSHLMSEMSLTADHLIVIGRGRLLADAGVAELTGPQSVLVRAARPAELAGLLSAEGASVSRSGQALTVTGMGSAAIGALAAVRGLALIELTPQRTTLEEAYMGLTGDSVEFGGGAS